MRAVRTLVTCLGAAAALGVLASPAMADVISGGSGQPVISGELHGEEPHGVLHCQPFAKALLGSSGREGVGVIVVNPDQTRLAAPAGACEEVYNLIF
jgi:hypothetical protein